MEQAFSSFDSMGGQCEAQPAVSPRASTTSLSIPAPFPTFHAIKELLEASDAFGMGGEKGPRARAVAPIRHASLAAGVWDCEAGSFDLTFPFDEFVHILEGEVHVRSEGKERHLRAGDVAFFRAGLPTTWVVKNYVRKMWVHHYPAASLATRIARKLSELAKRAFSLAA